MLGGAAAAGELVLSGFPPLSVSEPSTTQDRTIFAYMLLLEQLQAAFYAKALAARTLTGEHRQLAEVVGAHEEAHLRFVQRQLGGASRPSPTFTFRMSFTNRGFLTAAVGLEELGLGAYNGQAPNMTPAALRRAGTIISVEARHVAWARSLAGELPAPVASDVPRTQAQIMSDLKASGYVS